MSEDEVGTFARAAAPKVEAIGRRLIDSGLGEDNSLLTPGEPIWSTANLQQLKRNYVDKPDLGAGDFFEKLKSQLAGTSPSVVQLFAELLILNVLPIINMGGPLKLKQVQTVLDMSSAPATIPPRRRASVACRRGGIPWRPGVHVLSVGADRLPHTGNEPL